MQSSTVSPYIYIYMTIVRRIFKGLILNSKNESMRMRWFQINFDLIKLQKPETGKRGETEESSERTQGAQGTYGTPGRRRDRGHMGKRGHRTDWVNSFKTLS